MVSTPCPTDAVFRVAVLDDYQRVAGVRPEWEALRGRAEVVCFRDNVRGDDLLERLVDFDAVVLMRERTPMPAAVIERLPRLRLIVSSGRANALLDLEAARERGVIVCGTHGWAGVTATVEHTWALILGLARGIASEDAAIRDGRWMLGVPGQLAGRTLGIVGLGNIGSLVPPVGKALSMNVVAWSRNMRDADAAAVGIRRLDHDEFFSACDVISVHVKYSERSHHYIGRHELGLMAPHALLVNTSRGGVVDTSALLAALDECRIAGAALDVFDEEPLPIDHRLRRHRKCLVSPHIGYVSDVSYDEYFGQIVDDIVGFLDGVPVRRW